jgi:hypothetical protein
MILESNKYVSKALRKFYDDPFDRRDFPAMLRTPWEHELGNFTPQLDEIFDDLSMQTSRAKLLINIISDRKQLAL